jgi:hypothetical protein
VNGVAFSLAEERKLMNFNKSSGALRGRSQGFTQSEPVSDKAAKVNSICRDHVGAEALAGTLAMLASP